MKKLFAFLTLITFLAACGGGKKGENTDNSADTSAQANTENANNNNEENTAKDNSVQSNTPLSREEISKAKEFTVLADVEAEADKNTIVRYRPKNYAKEFPKALLEASNLHVLVLQNYGAASLPDDIKKFQKLTCLYLAGAKITKLPEAIGELKNLKTISLTACKKLDIKQALDVLKNCPKLENLSLSYMPFEELPAAIGELKNLKHLRIKNTHLKTLPEEFYTLANLEYLGLGSTKDNPYNYDEIFKKMKALPKLNKLFMPYCGLKALPDVMKEYPALKTIVWREQGWKDAKAEAKKWSDKFPNFEVTWSTSSTPLYDIY